MAEQHVNSFGKGMIKDLSEVLKPKDSYEDALDIRLNSNSSASDHIVTNVKGNKFNITVPDIPNIVLITLDGELPANWNDDVTVTTATGGLITGPTISGSQGEIDDYLDKLQEALETDLAFSGLDLQIARSGNRIRVWSTTSEITAINSNSNYVNNDLQLAQADQVIIGWDKADNDTYLLTTNDDTPEGGIGAIWQMNLDPITQVSTIELLYSDQLNFTQKEPIANPGGIETVHETPKIHRCYWTDRLNDLRSANLADENLMALTPESFSIAIDVTLEKPTLHEIITGGSLLVGHYQYAYCLRSGGGITPYSMASNSIFITDDSADAGYTKYDGAESGTVSGNAIRVRFPNVDTNYSTMDIIALFKEAENAPVAITKIAEIRVTNDTMFYTHTGSEETSFVSETDFNRVINLFNKCHAIAQKDNILFAANTKGEVFDIEFDTRAYRFNSNSEASLIDVSGNPISFTSNNDLATIPFELNNDSDAINPDQDEYRYQIDGKTVGGTGPNISYRFNAERLLTEVRDKGDNDHPFRITYRWGLGAETLGDGQRYRTGPGFRDHKSPYWNHIFRGYRREETYRFAWVPVKDGVEGYARWIADIKMPAMFTDDYVPTGNLPGYETMQNLGTIFPTMSKVSSSNDEYQVNQLGVVFIVNIPPEVAKKIDGFRIKRVKLEDSDRTILGQGIIHLSLVDKEITPVAHHPILHGVDNPFVDTTGAYATGWQALTLNSENYLRFVGNNDYYVWQFSASAGTEVTESKLVSFHSPEFLFGKPLQHRSGDKLKIVAGLSDDSWEVSKAEMQRLDKLYDLAPVNLDMNALGLDTEFSVTDGQTIGKGDEVSLTGGQYKNYSKIIRGLLGGDQAQSLGSSTTVLSLSEPIAKYISPNVAGSGFKFSPSGEMFNTAFFPKDKRRADKFLANYVRDVVQYGGQGFSARSQNVYISTGHYQQVPDDTGGTYQSGVYGGDTFVSVFDSYRMLKNFDEDTSPTFGDVRAASGLYFPVESHINLNLREGFHLNGRQNPAVFFYGSSNNIPDAEDYALDFGEDFKYNYVYSEEMDTQRAFPLPLNADPELRHPVRIWASDTKVYGELTDAWRTFDSEKYIDIRGDHGEIRQLINRNEQLYAWQERGFGIASVNERSVVSDKEGKGLILGKSGVLPRFDYISNIIGSWHQFGFAVSPTGVAFFDAKDGGIYVFDDKGLRDITQDKMKAWLYENTRGNILRSDSPLFADPLRAGVTSTYDNRNKEFLMTFHDYTIEPLLIAGPSTLPIYKPNSFTLAYDDKHDRFVSFRSHKPTMYINNDKFVLSPDPDDGSKVYLHDVGDRGTFYSYDPSTSYITIIPNGHPLYSKVFDNIRWYSEVFASAGGELSGETISGLTITTPYQTTGLRTNFDRRLREWRHSILYEAGTKNRIRNHYCKQKFEFENNDNKKFKLYPITNIYRVVPK